LILDAALGYDASSVCLDAPGGLSVSAFILKLIAVIVMLIDHVGAVFPNLAPHLDVYAGTFPDGTPLYYRVEFFRMVGRVAFPIFAYMAAQGCVHTKSINKYLMRLGLFALISEVPFDVAFMSFKPAGGVELNISFLSQTNVFYTLFLGVAGVAAYERLKANVQFLKNSALREFLALLPLIPIAMVGNILGTDYGGYGVMFIYVFYFAKPLNRLARTLAAAFVVFVEYGYPFLFNFFHERGLQIFLLPGQMMFYQNTTKLLIQFAFALAAVPLICLYNGKQGPRLKWAFYAFYPAHIAVLAVLWYFYV
jgi:hypothetical protein